MDKTTELITSYATTLRYSDLTPEAIHCTKRAFIDTLGCAMGGFLSEPSKIARRVAGTSSSSLPSRILGTSEYSSPDMAAFANTVMNHYLNLDGCWHELLSGGGGPSRMIQAILAVGEPLGAGGRAVITATVVAFDLFYRVCDRMDLMDLGWNQSLRTGLGTAAGLANLMGLTQDQAANLLSMAAINVLALRQTRASEVPMWVSCDIANANRDVVLYAFLARDGMTAPGEPFEGQWGLWRQSGAGPVELEPFAHNNQSFKVTQIGMKLFPCHRHADPPISLALQLREKVKIEEIEAINLQSYYKALYSIGGAPDKPERWDPQTREDADHSIPYAVAVAFQDGAVTPASFTEERIRDPELRPLMQKINITENPEFTRQYGKASNAAMEVVTRSGERFTASASYPKGHKMNPLTDQELESKFMTLAQEVISPAQCREALDLLWRLEELEELGPIFDALCV